MSERRPLAKGITNSPPVTEDIARAFVHGSKPGQPRPAEAPAQKEPIHKAPISTRIRDDFVKALKRASLERQLEGVEPNTLQDMLEEAIEPWLRQHGYLE